MRKKTIIGISAINTFLLDIENIIRENPKDNFIIKRREINKQTLTKIGMTPAHIKSEIISLTYKNYSNGPEQNISSSGNLKGGIWVFGKVIKGIEIYIKLHYIPFGEGKCICVSFHESSEVMEYPYCEI